MSLNSILPFLTAAVMAVFTVMVLQRYVVRRRLHFLFWGLGLGMFAIASFAGAYLTIAWSAVAFFAWYYFGAVLNAAYIGHGTVYLLVRKRWVHVLTAILLLASLVALMLMLQVMPQLDTSGFTTDKPISEKEQYANILPEIADGAIIRLTTPFFNIYGLITLAGGAIWSAYLFWRKRVLPNRVIGNVLIAVGALSVGLASTLTRLGYGSYHYLGELVAAILMFAGFLMAARPQPGEIETSEAQAAPTGD